MDGIDKDQNAHSVQSDLDLCCSQKYLHWPMVLKELTLSQATNFADDNFKFDENGRKLSERVENTVGKGEIARYEQFLLFPQCFQKACFPGASKGVIVWEWVKPPFTVHGSYASGMNTSPCILSIDVLWSLIFTGT